MICGARRADGLELCRRLRAQPERPYTYIVLVTSLAERADVLAGMHAGADDYLTKPLDPFALSTRLIAAERVTQLHAQLRRYQRDLLDLAHTDPLTQLRNRLSLNDDLATLHARADRRGTGYAIALCDAARDLTLFISELASFAGMRIERRDGDARRPIVQPRVLVRGQLGERGDVIRANAADCVAQRQMNRQQHGA